MFNVGGTNNSNNSSSSSSSLHGTSRNVEPTQGSSRISFPQSTSSSSSSVCTPLPDSEFEFPFCEDVNKYEKITKIGQGKSVI